MPKKCDQVYLVNISSKFISRILNREFYFFNTKGKSGIVLGSPVYFTDVTAEMKALIDRAGFVSIANGGML